MLIAEKICGIPEKINSKRAFRVVYRIAVIGLVIAGWVLFRADSLKEAVRYWNIMFGFKATEATKDIALLYLHTFRVELLLGVMLSVPIIPKLISYKPKYLKFIYDVIMMFLFFVSISYIVKGTYSPFIYFNF